MNKYVDVRATKQCEIKFSISLTFIDEVQLYVVAFGVWCSIWKPLSVYNACHRHAKN